MPVSPTYPGVYIEEISSGSHTIVGVPTSITAFVGRTLAGPVDEPKTCFSFADFERFFGGRAYSYPLTYAVEDFFLNGGGQAIVVRTFHREPGESADAAVAGTATFGALTGGPPISAIGPGTWGNNLSIAFDYLGLRTPGATPASTQLNVTFVKKPTAGEKLTFNVTPNGGTAVLVTYAANGSETTAFEVAQGLANAFNNTNALGFGTATASKGADDTAATVTIVTAGTGKSANDAATIAAPTTQSANVTLTPATTGGKFAGGLNATPDAATTTLTVAGGPATADGAIAYQLAVTGGRPILASVDVKTGDDAPTVAKKLADAFNAKFAGPNGVLKPVTLDAATGKLTLVAATAGAAGNEITFQQITAPPKGLTVAPPANVTLLNGADQGFGTKLADQAAKPYEHYGISGTDLFNVTVTYTAKGKQAATERYTGVTVNGVESPTRIDRVINAQSLLIKVNPEKKPWSFSAYGGTFQFTPQQKPVSISATGGADSGALEPADFVGDEDARTAMYALEDVDLFNLMCIPPDLRAEEGGLNGQDTSVYAEAAEYCAKRRAMLICDPPAPWANSARKGDYGSIMPTDVDVTTEDGGRNAAVFFPFVWKPDMELNGKPELFAPSGSIAGQFAQTDITRGVWKAPAGIETGLEGVTDLDVKMTDAQNGVLNPLGINAIRYFPIIGPVIWGARTLRGADVFSDDYKYIPVRRLTLYIEESLYRGTKWAVFEPNGETLWSQLRLSVGTFMADLSRQGAFYGYSVTCDKSTTLQSDIDKGIVNVVVAFAPVKPAEFVVLKIAQLAGQTPG